MPPDVTVVGSINLDLVAFAPRLPKSGETISQATLERYPGGKGANQALAAARLGADVHLVGAVGVDSFDREALGLLTEGGVDLSAVLRVQQAATGVALIVVADNGENQIVVAPGANLYLDPIHVRGSVAGADAVLCQLEVPAQVVTAAATANRGFFCLNAAPAYPLLDVVLRRADLIVVNRYEYEALPEFARKQFVALTLGEEGAVLLEHGNEVARAQPPDVQAVDGTAAGDAFTACIVVSLLEGRGRDEALRRACAAGALAASRRGAQPSLPTAAEVDEILGE